ncbi:MAG: HesA/MoeB/ThiF family protein [Spirochaetales bacterium]|nr:HesA/MoeB/ThiF family protein [Spirochaetales bacterium]
MDAAELARYQRQIVLPGMGERGQQKLKEASVLIVGLGGLGSPLALYLAAAGIGKLGLVDGDQVEVSNLHRQILYSTEDAGKPKVQAAAARLQRLNPHLQIEVHQTFFETENGSALVAPYQWIADGTDRLRARHNINRVCVQEKKKAVFAAVEGFEGTLFVHDPCGACFACLFPETHWQPIACAEAGVLGPVPGALGTLQAQLILSHLLAVPGPRFVLIDLRTYTMKPMQIERNPRCSVCGQSGENQAHPGQRSGRPDASGDNALVPDRITVHELKALREAAADSFLLLDVRERQETEISRIEGSLLIPISEFTTRLGELDPERTTIVYCKVGIRSAQVVEYLKARGFKDVRNLLGGINEWADRIDPDMPVY